MKQFWIICVIFVKFSGSKVVDLRFPEGFIFGAGSSAYQIEGAWNVSDKGESVWDQWTHTNPSAIVGGSNGDIACDSYHKYKQDVQHIKSIGLDFYRFSISWSRVLPNGLTNVISKDGLQYYKNLTAELVANGIQPVVTLHHMDHPQFLEEMGGWTNELMVDWFVAYARVIFEALGEHVKIWITVNEPNFLCKLGYDSTTFAPGFGDLLRSIKNKYDNPPVRVMENGYPDSGELDDYERISYHHDCLKELLIAVNEDGCSVKSYAAWGLVDDFEWSYGYSMKFGMFYVEFNDTNRPRTAKRSASWWESVLASRKLQPIPTDSESSDL